MNSRLVSGPWGGAREQEASVVPGVSVVAFCCFDAQGLPGPAQRPHPWQQTGGSRNGKGTWTATAVDQRGEAVVRGALHDPAANMVAVPEGTKISRMTSGARRKVHYTMPDESEMVEEFDLQTDELLLRKRRTKTVLGKEGEWVFEVGEPPARVTIEGDMLRPSSSNPTLVRKDRPHAFEWRIRNLPYPKPTYSVTIDPKEDQIVIRTANKKYFKRLTIEDMQRARLALEEAALSWSHENNTLIVCYKKPEPILKLEKEAKSARLNAPETVPAAAEDGAPDCKQQ